MNIRKQNNKIIIEIEEEEIRKLLKESTEKIRSQYFYFARAILSFMKRNKQKFNNEFRFETFAENFQQINAKKI